MIPMPVRVPGSQMLFTLELSPKKNAFFAMLVITAPNHKLAKRKSLPLHDLKKYPLISQFQGSDHDVQQIFRRAKMRPKTKYILDDDISVMGMVAQDEGIALMPEMMLATAAFDLAAIPLKPQQHRTIGLATPPDVQRLLQKL